MGRSLGNAPFFARLEVHAGFGFYRYQMLRWDLLPRILPREVVDLLYSKWTGYSCLLKDG